MACCWTHPLIGSHSLSRALCIDLCVAHSRLCGTHHITYTLASALLRIFNPNAEAELLWLGPGNAGTTGVDPGCLSLSESCLCRHSSPHSNPSSVLAV